jgi:hypothetical protein
MVLGRNSPAGRALAFHLFSLPNQYGSVATAATFMPRRKADVKTLMIWNGGIEYLVLKKYSPIPPIGKSSQHARATPM